MLQVAYTEIVLSRPASCINDSYNVKQFGGRDTGIPGIPLYTWRMFPLMAPELCMVSCRTCRPDGPFEWWPAGGKSSCSGPTAFLGFFFVKI